MRINADLHRRAVIETGAIDWVASPAPGVYRKPLDRDGDEIARATSLVRYDPGSRFSGHRHDQGEEFLVLAGTFSDERGDYPAGTYVRNPPGSAHSPYSRDGCTLFVKLRQIPPDDAARVVVDTRARPWLPGTAPGLGILPLHEHGAESVALVRWAPGTRFHRHVHPGGEEIFVLEGVFADEQGVYPQGAWLRNPPHSAHAPYSETGCLIYVKIGHLG